MPTVSKAEFVESSLYKGKVKIRFYEKSHQYWLSIKGEPFRRSGGSVTGITGIKDKSEPLVIWATELAEEHLLTIHKSGKQISEEDIYTACALHSERKEKAADIGTKIHDWIKNYIRGLKPEMPEEKEVQIGVNAFLDWVKAHKVEFLTSERAIYSLKHDFTGTMDLEARIGGKRVLVDYKSSSGIYNTMNLQTAAYVMADQEESGKKYHGRYIIRLAKETEKEYNIRMAKKNKRRELKGKELVEYPPYQVFETKFLDDEKGNLDRDFKAFLACKELKTFDNLTGFWATNKK